MNRKLNNKTIPDRQPIPKIQDMLDCLRGQQWFSTLDMSKAYHQGYIHPDSRKYAAFYCWRTSFTVGFPRVLLRLCEKLFNYFKTTL